MATNHCALCETPDFLYADCVEGGRSDLARKVLEVVGDPYGDKVQCFGGDEPREVSAKMLTALRELFAKEGVDGPLEP